MPTGSGSRWQNLGRHTWAKNDSLRPVTRLVMLLVSLTGFWALLSGQFHNTLLLATGAVSIIGVGLLAAYRMQIVDDDLATRTTWIRLVVYVPYLTWEIILANWDVLKRVWDPVMPIEPRMIRIPYSTKTAFGTTTYANSITLTPGTVTVEVDRETMLIHALSREAEDGLREGTMEREVKKLEGSL